VSAQSPRLLLPFVVAAYLGLLAPLVVVIAVPSARAPRSNFRRAV
jgi:hypothetical protein